MANRYGLSIRAAAAGDADALGELLRSGGFNVPRDRLVSRLVQLQAQPGAVLVAEEWGPPTGIVTLHWTARLTVETPLAEISFLLVDPERRRNGVARLLLKAASQAARVAGCSELLLRASEGAGALQAFCLATGFSPEGTSYSRSLRKRS